MCSACEDRNVSHQPNFNECLNRCNVHMCVILFYLTYISKYKTNLSNYSIYRTLYSIKANEQKGRILCFLFRYLSWIFYIFSQHRLCLAADLISPTLHPAQPSSQKEEKQSERMQDNTDADNIVLSLWSLSETHPCKYDSVTH